MAIILRLRLLNSHSTFSAIIGALALALLVLNNIVPLNVLTAVNTLHLYEGTNRLMSLNLFSYTLGLAVFVRLTFYRGKLALIVMCCHLMVLEHLSAPHGVVAALELHLLKLLFHVFFHAEELGLLALHGAHACLVVKFFKALVVKSLLARFALHRVN